MRLSGLLGMECSAINTNELAPTLLLPTIGSLQIEYSETSARELSERVSLLAELDRLENREAPIFDS